MSTKNLARTVIEGGRTGYSRFMRRHSHAVERAHAHQVERRLAGADALDDVLFEPRKIAYRGFSDKLGPAWRWLRSQVGRPWDKVRSELFARFDARTTPGRHILFGHMLAEVDQGTQTRFAPYYRFRVSRHGILQNVETQRYRSTYRKPPLPEPESELRAWLGGRRVARREQRLYWLKRTEHDRFRQERELTSDEVARFEGLPRWFREPFEGWEPPAERQR
jgi:hypothetical protein